MDNIKYEVVDSSPFQFQNTNTSKMETSNNASKLSMKSDSHSFDQKVRDYIQKNNYQNVLQSSVYNLISHPHES